MQTKDFKGQDLRGWSFKNQDLTGADFSDCDLRGVDFSFANLTDAKFCRAKIDKTFKVDLGFAFIHQFLGMFCGYLAVIGNSSVIYAIGLDSNTQKNQIIITSSYALLIAMITILGINRSRWNYIGWFFISTSILVTIIAMDRFIDSHLEHGANSRVIGTVGLRDGMQFAASAVMGVIILIFSIAISSSNVLYLIMTIFGIPFGIVNGALFTSIVFSGGGKFNQLFLDAVFPTTIYIILGVYIGWRAIKKEETFFSFFRELSLKIACIGSSQFAFANLGYG
jgi:hypothetical protein